MRPCALVPLYEHGATLGAVLRGLAAQGLPMLVVDDGSGPATRAELERLEAELPGLAVRRHARNRGKGAALRTGYREAARLGYTHVVQIDADGQHDPAEAPRVLEAMRAQPGALVLGRPVFDASVPRSRLWGRQLSRGCVWAATGCLDVADPLCGYRGVPLEPVLRALDAAATGDRMDFEPEIAVRLHWAGVPVRNLPVRVVYPEHGLSHFDVVWDDLRLAGLYTRLLLQAPLRIAARRLRTASRRNARGEPEASGARAHREPGDGGKRAAGDCREARSEPEASGGRAPAQAGDGRKARRSLGDEGKRAAGDRREARSEAKPSGARAPAQDESAR